MQENKYLGILGIPRRGGLGYGRRGAAPIIVVAALTWASGAAASTDKPIHVFTGTAAGAYPTRNMIFDAAGNLYGTTFKGGADDYGVVFKLKPNRNGTWTESVLHSFAGADGANPAAGLVFDAAGDLYGTTAFGGADGVGTIFELKPNPNGTWAESVLYSFTGGADGREPSAGLIFDAAGNLYGTTLEGGTIGYGVVFKLAPNADGTWTESVLHSFTDADGGFPQAGLIFDTAGNLYGTTLEGGGLAGSYGVVFKLAPNPDGTWTESVLHSFGGPDGGQVDAGLIFDAVGNVYGTTSDGGSTVCPGGCGVVFKLAPNRGGTWTESVLHSFIGTDGEGPAAGLIFDAAGNLYGTTNLGGPHGDGVVFKLMPTLRGWTERVILSFGGLGSNPLASVIFDSAGNLYGTTSSGRNNNGLVFEITP